MNARPRREILRQSAVVVAIEHHGDAALGDARQLRQRDRQQISGDGDRLSMKIARRIRHVTFIGKEKRIVGRGVDLAFRSRARETDRIAAGAVHLRRAANRIWILHCFRALDEMAPLDQLAHASSAADLSRMPTRLMNFVIERALAAAHSFERHRRGGVGHFREMLPVEYA